MFKLSQTQQLDLAHAVQEAQRLNVALAELKGLYGRVHAEIDRRQPLCQISGRCCHFDRYGHRLFVTTLELAAFSAELSLLRGAGDPSKATDPGGCSFQIDRRCSVHSIRPFGCRIFFCDPTAEAWQQAQYEAFHAEIRQMHERHAVPYYYVEWREALAACRTSLP